MDPQVLALASEIHSFLLNHPQAADTVEHICRWWILRHRIETGIPRTQSALDYLASQHVVERLDSGIYRLIADQIQGAAKPGTEN
jgi:hypothetical protein